MCGGKDRFRFDDKDGKGMDVIERMPVLDKADAIAALPELVKAYFRMHGRLSNCDVHMQTIWF
jgi:hypothetical protein